MNQLAGGALFPACRGMPRLIINWRDGIMEEGSSGIMEWSIIIIL